MIKKILNYFFTILTFIMYFGIVNLFIPQMSNIHTQWDYEFFMPFFAISLMFLPLPILGLFLLNVKKGSLVIGIIFLVIGLTLLISDYNHYNLIQLMDNESNNYSEQLGLVTFEILKDVLIVVGGICLLFKKRITG